MFTLIRLLAVSPATGNTESSTYIWLLIAAGILIAAAVIAGIFTKKKHK